MSLKDYVETDKNIGIIPNGCWVSMLHRLEGAKGAKTSMLSHSWVLYIDKLWLCFLIKAFYI